MNVVKVRTGSIDDLDILVRHRSQMWQEIYPDRISEVVKSEEQTRAWISTKLKAGLMLPFIAEDVDGNVIGSGCLLVREDQPRPFSTNISEVYLLSMFTTRENRGKGVSTSIVKRSIQWAEENGYDRVTLHASGAAKSLYNKLGFAQTNEMKLELQ